MFSFTVYLSPHFLLGNNHQLLSLPTSYYNSHPPPLNHFVSIFPKHPTISQANNAELERVDQRGSNVIFYFSDVSPEVYALNIIMLAAVLSIPLFFSPSLEAGYALIDEWAN